MINDHVEVLPVCVQILADSVDCTVLVGSKHVFMLQFTLYTSNKKKIMMYAFVLFVHDQAG